MTTGGSMFNRPVTEEEIQQILRERAERLDPANRPPNSQVDNTVREWDFDLQDFRDNLEGRPAGHQPEAGGPQPLTSRPSFLRVLGLALGVVALFFGWLTWAFFTKAFTEYADVKLVAAKSGLSLPERADVKLRGMIVGVVRETRLEDDKVVMTLGLDPNLIDRVPANVRAEVVPKTLFGEKYIDLVPTAAGSGASLKAGDTITDSVVPVEVEEFLNDIYPLLKAVPPEDVATTLTALASTLEGRGESFGQTLEEANEYLTKLNPETQLAVDDIVALGRVSQTYAGQMDTFGELLENSAEISETVVDKEDELEDLFGETNDLAVVLSRFFEASGDDIIATAANSRQPLAVGAEYSSVFPCLFKGLDKYIDQHLNELYTTNNLHIDLIVVPQPSKYEQPSDDPDSDDEHPIIPKESDIEALDLTQPDVHGYKPNPDDPGNPVPAGLGTLCDELYAAAAGNGRTPDRPLPQTPELWKLIGVKNSHHGKLGTDADFNRSPVTTSAGR